MKYKIFMAFVEVFVIVNAIFAFSYFIGEGNSERVYLPETNNGKLFFGKVLNFISIKQIGSVSAEGVVCCEKAKTDSAGNGAWCYNTAETTECDPNYSTNPNLCTDTSFCNTGTCVYDNGLSCAEGSTETACVENGGEFELGLTSAQVPQCQKGCCTLGSEANFVTQKYCEENYAGREFHPEITSEIECNLYPLRFESGACVLTGGDCRHITGGECERSGGDFYPNNFCSDDALKELGVDCDARADKVCGENNVYDYNVYWVDSCGNQEGVAEQCGYPQEGCIQAFEAEEGALCIDLNCKVDRNYDGDTSDSGDEAINGESWCVYESAIGLSTIAGDGFGSDAPGSEHFLARCNNGEVGIEKPRDDKRKDICVEQVTEENGLKISSARFVPNRGEECITYNPINDADGRIIPGKGEACNENKHCMLKHVEVDDYFKFDTCVPRYPSGFDASETASRKCSFANIECPVVYEKDERALFGESDAWKCVENCDCEDPEFAQQMNNLCVSLGDCGSYINYIGRGTDNVRITDRNYGGDSGEPYQIYSSSEYVSQKNPVPGKVVNPYSIEDLAASIGNGDIQELIEDIRGDPNWEGTLGDFMSGRLPWRNNIGLAGGAIALIVYLGGTYATPAFSFAATATGIELQALGVYETTTSGALTSGLVPQWLATASYAALGASLGGIVGAWVAQQLGVSGSAAQALVYSGAALGAAYATIPTFTLTAAGGIGFAIVAWIQLSGWGQTEERKVVFECLPWTAPYGGSDCEICNNNPGGTPCTKYKCESLGRACKYINPNSDEASCISLVYEPNPPIITPLVVETEGYEFQNEEEKSVEIAKSSGECIPEFTNVEFKLQTDENAECRWGFQRTANYDDLRELPAEGNLLTLNHTFEILGFSVDSLRAEDVSGDVIQGITGDVNIYVKCKDSHGNANIDEYVVNYCIHDGEDTTAPRVNKIIPKNNGEIANGITETKLELWTNEPADCSYGFTPGTLYEDMTPMTCLENNWLNGYELNGWPCSTTLSDLKEENSYFIKCRDKPWETDLTKRNTMGSDYEYKFYVTDTPLEISSVSVGFRGRTYSLDINGTSQTEIIGGGDFPVNLKAKTSGGADNGVSSCSYEFTENPFSFEGTFGDRFSQISSEHRRDNLNLISGEYNVLISCEDSVGNSAIANGRFNLKVDTENPEVVRIFAQGGSLNLVTNEDAKCYYRTTSCVNFYFNTQNAIDGVENATSMTTGFSTTHRISSNENEFYIKCVDNWNNLNSCLTLSKSDF